MRTNAILRLYVQRPFSSFGMPLYIGAGAFAVILAIGVVVTLFAGVGERAEIFDGMSWNGAVFAMLGPLLFLGVSVMTQYFPLALGLGLTRREFVTGTSLTFVVSALVYALVVFLMRAVKMATNGYGLGVRMFDVKFVGSGPLWHTFVQVAVTVLAGMFLMAVFATVQRRWGTNVLWLVLVSLLLVVGLVGALASIVAGGVGVVLSTLGAMTWGAWMVVVGLFAVVAAIVWVVIVRKAPVR